MKKYKNRIGGRSYKNYSDQLLLKVVIEIRSKKLALQTAAEK